MNPLGFTPCLTLERPNLTADPSRTLFRAKKLFPELVYDTVALEDSTYTFPEDKATFLALHRLVAEEEALEWGAFRTGAVSIAGTTHPPTAGLHRTGAAVC